MRAEKACFKHVENLRYRCRIPRPTRIDLPHDSLPLGFESCPISHRLLDPSFG
jgi:hypothetical protein